ncbi:MAG TPA: exonuclease domain-containing protein [Intrasporangium sp.]|uniref:exonuclease domain-containing protein n=1 Tax=Intrasporangium sp. TaxID=1925024 RepID=UPI002D79387C|nr:exonuclease domain-containing protein [Intrasporangium sp.]HET7398852.1 exonuclease domain-containing protein [Intrasporangium sp.]
MILDRLAPAGRRRRLAGQVPPGPLRTYLETPPPGPGTDVTRLPLLALDLETTGLDPRRDAILSAGFVPLDGLEITLSGSDEILCRADVPVGQSAAVHGLTDDELRSGVALDELVQRIAEALTGRVLLAHHAPLETGFLTAAAQRLFGVPFPAAVVDTMELQRRLLGQAHEAAIPPGALRLPTARAHLGLPRHRAHRALGDAVAAAELYLAQVARLGGGKPMTLRALQR